MLPGDADADTKPSKHTKKFKQMYGEGDALKKANERQKKELDQLKIKHDREDDRARAQDTSRKNRQSTTDESLWANIHKKRQRIKQGSGEKMRKVGDKGAPTPDQMKRAKGESVTEEMKCPPATQDLKINTKNRDATIKNFNYAIRMLTNQAITGKISQSTGRQLKRQQRSHSVETVLRLIFHHGWKIVCERNI